MTAAASGGEGTVSDSVYLGKATAPPGLRLYAVGDVHGCDDMLADVHRRIAADLAHRPPADHRIVHLGDAIDRGPDSAGVIQRLADMTAADPRVICMAGNHDQMLMDFLRDPARAGPVWLDNGGDATLRSYGVTAPTRGLAYLAGALSAAMPTAHQMFLRGLPRIARFGDFVFVHAGVRPGVPLERQDADDLIWVREPFLSDGRDLGFVAVHGHTPVREPDVRANRINIDTGAVYGGALTCLAIDGTDWRFL